MKRIRWIPSAFMALSLAACGILGDDASLRGDACADVPIGEWISLGMAEVPVSAAHLDVMNPGIILASTGRHEVDGEVVNGALWRSTDCGRTFTRIDDRMGGITRFHQSRTHPNWIYAVNLGLWRSYDRGRTFEQVGLPYIPTPHGVISAEAFSIALNPRSPSHLLTEFQFNTWIFMPTSGSRTELAETRDSGENWTHSYDPSGRLSLLHGIRIPTFKPDDPTLVYAAFQSNTVGRSMDGGSTWVKMPDTRPTAGYIYDIALLPGDPIRVVAATSTGLRFSTDGGLTWRSLTGDGFEAHHPLSNMRYEPGFNRIVGYSGHRLVRCDPDAETCEVTALDIPVPPPSLYRRLGVDVGISETRWYAVARADGLRLRAWAR